MPIRPNALTATELRLPAGWRTAGWVALFGALALWVARRLGAFDLWSNVTAPDGSIYRLPNGFATVDHPFHTVRAETLRQTLADGAMLRWIGHHQGGYPVEFYPLGAAALDVLTWTVALGSLPMVAAHKLTVIVIFLLPIVGFLLIAGFDRRSPGIALMAGAAHVSIRGWWWSGGSMELIEWGLVTNVAAATALVICLPLVSRYLRQDDRWAGGLGAALAAFALVTNPRSGLALAALLGGALIAVAASDGAKRVSVPTAIRRGSVVVAVAGLLAAPEIVSLARFNDLYYFVHYSGYTELRAYWESSVQAVGGRVVLFLGLAGLLLAWLPGERVGTRAASASAALYCVGTVFLVDGIGPASLIDQLEATRLMPFQRLLWLFLAASAVEQTATWAVRSFQAPFRTYVVDGILVALAGAFVLLYVVSPPSFIPVENRGMVEVASTASPGLFELEQAVEAADAAAAPGTALLVLGTRNVPNAWHDQLWAPLWSDRPFFYDDWLWYWQTEHVGDYNPEVEHAYRSDASALDRDYLDEHGIGAVVVTGDARDQASQESYLTREKSGNWDVYRVADPTNIITFGGDAPTTIDVGNQTITASGSADGGEIIVRRNWFPRWTASVNGEQVEIRHRDDGYMSIAAPLSGAAVVELQYGLDWVDWLARACSVVGMMLLIALLLPVRIVSAVIPRARLGRR